MFTRVFAAFVFFCAASNIRAEIIVTFQSTSITANQAGFVDVWVESSTNDTLTGFEAYFQIVAPSSASGTLSFASQMLQPNSQTLFGSNYVLSNPTGLDPDNYSAIPLSATEIRLIDFLNLNQKPLGTTKWRLARFALVHSGNASLAVGDTYEIKMFQSSSQDSNDTTTFFDLTGTNLEIGGRGNAGEPFSNSGSIRVTAGAAVVPEPSITVTLELLTAFLGFREHRKGSRNSRS